CARGPRGGASYVGNAFDFW
nr:immunoglobulin heavy chain junction region [Macaca mulatta]MPN83889.1 immunoglobulin heavy chain junction region [Macaca mulatta]MPN84025.1 immunoglobulin heavy chain junction region [Macaca mulatta]MPN84159.1 immunoglobulin heavy chain junction region [Macaca mulatta]MPN84312.1 immunoglobulin heavy chain junction region [Macaca mulatta]